jgi:ABC-type multidrug transport system ATPase subunit
MIEGFRLGVYSRGATLWDGLDFAFGNGVAWLVAGPPSSGKTLLLSILRGERRPDAGDVLVSGESLYRGSAALALRWRASCGYVPEQAVVDGRLTVEDLFLRSALAGVGLRGRDRKDRADRLLGMVGLPGASGWRIAELSISERVRAFLAAELLRGPKVLFCDGVVAGAGIPCREMLWGLFRALAREGNTVILAERTIPERWALATGDAETVGPFRVYRLPVPGKEGKEVKGEPG